MNPTIAELLAHPDICGISTSGTSLSFLVLLTTGLLVGFSHCFGMCGPLVSTFMVSQHRQGSDATSALLTFQLGRLTTYGLLGMVAGSLGSLVRITVVAQGWQGAMSIVIGGMMLVAGLNLLGLWPTFIRPSSTGLFQKVSRQLRTFIDRQHPIANFALGLSNGLLPCAPLYTMLLLAATTGSPLGGALAMFVFGLGTLPAMLGVGLFISQIGIRLRTHLYQVAATLIALVGVQLVLRGLALGDHVAHLSVSGVMLW